MPVATAPSASPRPSTLVKMEDRKRPAISSTDDLAPPSKRVAVNGAKAKDEALEMKEEGWIDVSHTTSPFCLSSTSKHNIPLWRGSYPAARSLHATYQSATSYQTLLDDAHHASDDARYLRRHSTATNLVPFTITFTPCASPATVLPRTCHALRMVERSLTYGSRHIRGGPSTGRCKNTAARHRPPNRA